MATPVADLSSWACWRLRSGRTAILKLFTSCTGKRFRVVYRTEQRQDAPGMLVFCEAWHPCRCCSMPAHPNLAGVRSMAQLSPVAALSAAQAGKAWLHQLPDPAWSEHKNMERSALASAHMYALYLMRPCLSTGHPMRQQRPPATQSRQFPDPHLKP